MKRAIGRLLSAAGILLGLFFLVSFGLLGWRMVAPVRAAPRPEPCAEIEVETNGWHTNLLIPAALLPVGHPLRRLFPHAQILAVGWGDRDAYRTGAQQPWRHALALIPPRPSVLHVAADPGWKGRRVAVAESGVRGLSAYLESATRLNAEGAAIVVSQGQVPGRSVFVEGREAFHIFNVCNQWTARALKAAGLPVSDLGAWTSQSVMRQISAAPVCPRFAQRRSGA